MNKWDVNCVIASQSCCQSAPSVDTETWGTPLYLWAPIAMNANSWRLSLLAVCWRGGARKILLLEVLSPVCPNCSFSRVGVSGTIYFKLMCLRTVWLRACSDFLNFTLCACVYTFLFAAQCLFFVLACVFIYSSLCASFLFPFPLHQLFSSTGVACFV